LKGQNGYRRFEDHDSLWWIACTHDSDVNTKMMSLTTEHRTFPRRGRFNVSMETTAVAGELAMGEHQHR
jgi:hypothetical protein